MKIALTSIPKSGTHLLATVIENIVGDYSVTLRKNLDPQSRYARKAIRRQVVGGHLRISAIMSPNYFPFFQDRKVIALIRDPRDICNSMIHYIEKSHRIEHKMLSMALNGLEYDEKICRIADGINISETNTRIPPIDVSCRGFIEVVDHFTDSIIIRYEDFFEADIITQKISNFLEISPDSAHDAVMKALKSDTKTKRVGKSQHWRETFSPYLIKYFAEQHGDLIRYMGYDA